MKIFILLTSLLISSNSFGYCFKSASKKYQISEKLLTAIAMQESSLNSKAINKVGGEVGLMQIHPQWFKQLEALGITRDILLLDPCTNLHVGAWILATNFKRHGFNWNSVGGYNAGFSTKNEVAVKNRLIYISKIKKKLIEIESAKP